MLNIKFVVSCLVSLLVILSCSTAYAVDTKPSDASLKELLTVTEIQKHQESSMVQLENLMRSAFQQTLKGQTIPPGLQKVFDGMQNKIMTLLKEEMAWDKTEPMFFRIYRESLTQEEVDGMLAFYKSPAGQAVIKKMPIIMKNNYVEMQKRIGPIMQKMQKMQQEMLAEIKEEEAKQKPNNN